MKSLKIIRRLLLIIIVLLLVFVGFYTYAISPTSYSFNKTTYNHQYIDDHLNGMTIAYLSDIHLSDDKSLERFKSIIDELNQYPFDMVIFNGDLYDNHVFSNQEVSSLLKSIYCKYGKFALLGDKDLNHESEITTILNDGGFEVLNNELRTIYYNDTTFELVASNDDISNHEYKDNTFTLCIAHKPDTFLFNKNYAELQLSGHSLGGQFYLPYIGPIFKTEGALTYNHGIYEEENATLIVSNGITGTKDNPYKFISTNHIELITLKKGT